VIIAPKAPERAALEAAAGRGFVAARVHMLEKLPGRLSAEEMLRVAHCAADVGWHIEVHCAGHQLETLLDLLRTLPCRAVIDHMAYPDPGLHSSVQRALDLPNVYAKISAPDRVDARNYEIGAAAARKLIDQAPDKLVWGNDWPHVGIEDVDDNALVGLLTTYPDEAVRRILVETPQRLYFSRNG
jgi:predicted TIM-barrel fold metal-dependent hydrolase